MPLVQEAIREHFGRPPRKGVHPDECVALGAALLGDSLDQIDSITLVDVLSMPIGVATSTGRFRRVLEKNNAIPCSRSFRLPPPKEPGQPIEIDIYQGDSDDIVDDEFLGSIRLPAAATGRRIDFKLDEECLLKVTFDEPEQGMREVGFATRDTPDAVRRAVAEGASRQTGGSAEPEVRRGGGLFGWLRRS
jgi:molecular chaperone DnaK